jgi:hypothetical protein
MCVRVCRVILKGHPYLQCTLHVCFRGMCSSFDYYIGLCARCTALKSEVQVAGSRVHLQDVSELALANVCVLILYGDFTLQQIRGVLLKVKSFCVLIPLIILSCFFPPYALIRNIKQGFLACKLCVNE